jgi:carboxyl-terminal processing protease
MNPVQYALFFRWSSLMPLRFSISRPRFLSVAGLVLCAVLAGGCATKEIGKTGISVPLPALPIPGLPLFGPGEGDLRYFSWERAFREMHERIAAEYPYTEAKQLDWDALYARFAPAIASAQAQRDATTYYVALREYLYSIPDGHVRISTDPDSAAKFTGGTLGCGLARLDSGEVIVVSVDAGGPAARAGVAWGDTVLAVGGIPIDTALAHTDVIWSAAPPATASARTLARLHRLTHPVTGATVALTIQTPGTAAREVALVAVRDHAAAHGPALDQGPQDEHASPISAMMLEDGIGYLRIAFFGKSLSTPRPQLAMAEALKRLEAQGLAGLVVDLRFNIGGLDQLAADFAGHFLEKEVTYARVFYHDAHRKDFVERKEERIVARPAAPHIAVPLVLLVNYKTACAAEGFARLLVEHARAQVCGFEGTHGTFGITGGGITMPKGHTVFYPVGRMTDEEGNVVITTNAEGEGGIVPGIRVPATRETLAARYGETQDLVRDAAVAALRRR